MELRLYRYFVLILISTIFRLKTSAFTDPLDVIAIHDLYTSLNYPPQLNSWRMESIDPCEELWTGVACFGSSIIYLKLDGLSLSGNLGGQLHNFLNLRQLDISSNSISGSIPYNLPPNATHLDFSSNHLSQNLPNSMAALINLRHLNVSHNCLSGSLGLDFSGLQSLRELDLSYNHFTGDLPSSIAWSLNLTVLFLQNNNFTGAVTLLGSLPLTYLNIQDDQFGGVIPKSFQNIPYLWLDGNDFDAVNSEPWDLPRPTATTINSPPTTQSSALVNIPLQKLHKHMNKLSGIGEIALYVGGGTFFITLVALAITIHLHRTRLEKPEDIAMQLSSISSSESLAVQTLEEVSERSQQNPILPIESQRILRARFMPFVRPIRHTKQLRRESFSENQLPPCAKIYTLEQIQLATDNFSQAKLIGEGSLGSVYRADFVDGKILAVKVIPTTTLSFAEEEEFFQVIRTVYQLKHPNIVPLVGYCIEHRQHILVYEYVKNLTLQQVLHSRRYKPLSWTARLHVAVEVARALDYMHYRLSPPVTHGNLNARNILLDEELSPQVSDCGLVVLRPLTSNSVKLKSSEMAIEDSVYVRLDETQPRIEGRRRDVYAFGVLLLQLLTGRMPFDDSRPRQEKSLVKWAIPRLGDRELMEQMVEHTIRGFVGSRSLSQLSDIISLCLQIGQRGKEFHLSITGVMEYLVFLQERAGISDERSEIETNDNRSFRSTNTCFYGSPNTNAHSSP